jgi:hypothetical protein
VKASTKRARIKSDRFCLWLGRFILEFATTERAIFLLLVMQSGMRPMAARAAFSDARVDKARDAMRRIREALQAPADDLLNRALVQLGAINKARNDLLHSGIERVEQGVPIVSNQARIHLDNRLNEQPMPWQVLRAMTMDLSTIRAAFSALMMSGELPGQRIGFPSRDIARLRHLARAPWRYIPPPPSAPDRRRPPSPP